MFIKYGLKEGIWGVLEDNYVYGVARRWAGPSFRGPVIGCSPTPYSYLASNLDTVRITEELQILLVIK